MIDHLLRRQLASPDFAGLTIWPTADGGFQCSVKRRSENGDGWGCVKAADPVDGLRRALGDDPEILI